MVMVQKKILVRAGMSPLEQPSLEEIIAGDLVGNNNGNLLYQFSVFRTLQLPDTELVPNRYAVSREDADEINSEYSQFVLPFANAFKNKPHAIEELREYTALIKELKIPVTLIGIGLQAPVNTKPGDDKFPFDEDVKAFVKAILEKSSIIGVRGQITADYLTGLGFTEGRDHTVIGCPSMYTYGPDLHIREPARITPDSLVYVNSVPNAASSKYKQMYEFINSNLLTYPNHWFVPTEGNELELTYAGVGEIPYKFKDYPASASNPVYASGRAKYPVNVPTWIDMLADADLVYGARLHGCIAATLAGTPSVMFPKDSRMKELVEYHGLTAVDPTKITSKTTLEELVESVDFQSPVKKQAANFDHYVDFLNKNNLNHIWKKNKHKKDAVFEKKLKEVTLTKPIQAFSTVSREELIKRYNKLNKAKAGRHKVKVLKSEKAYNTRLKKLNALLRTRTERLNKYEKTLNRKPVRLARKAAKRLKLSSKRLNIKRK